MKEVISNNPMGWNKKNLKNITTFLRRGKSPVYSDRNEGLLIINQDCIRWDKIDLDKVKYHKLPGKILDEFYLIKNDILINSTGTGTIGRVNQWANNDLLAVVDGHVTIIRIMENEADSRYVRYFLSSEVGQRYLESVCYTGSTNQIELSKRYLAKFNLPCPSLPEQYAIANILSKVDEVIKVIENCINEVEKLKKSLLQNLLTGKLKSDGTWRSDEEFYFDKKFGKVPKRWRIEKMRDVVNRITDGEHLSPDFQKDGAFLLSAEDVYDDGIRFKNAKFVKTEDCEKFRKRCNPENGDVLIVSRGASIGRTCRLDTNEVFCLMGSVILIKPNNERLIGGFISQYMKSYKSWVELQRLSGTTAQQAIYLTHLNKLKIPYPKDFNEQNEIADQLEIVDRVRAEKQSKIQTLKILKKSLLQNLLTGKVRVDVEMINALLGEA